MAMAQSWEVVVMDNGRRFPRRTAHLMQVGDQHLCGPLARLRQFDRAGDRLGELLQQASPLCRWCWTDGGSAPSTGFGKAPRATRSAWGNNIRY